MKQQIATNKFQSERLLKCGVPAESAIKGEKMGTEIIDLTPAWSLSVLLGLFPKEMGIAVGAYPDSDRTEIMLCKRLKGGYEHGED